MLTSSFVPSLDPLVVARRYVVCDSVAVAVVVVGVSSNATGREEVPGTNVVVAVVVIWKYRGN